MDPNWTPVASGQSYKAPTIVICNQVSILQYLPSLDHKIETKIYFFKTNCKRNSDNFSFHKKAINVEVLLSVNIAGVKFTRGALYYFASCPPACVTLS